MERYTIRAAGYLKALRELMKDTATTSIAPEYLNDDGTYPLPDAPFDVVEKNLEKSSSEVLHDVPLAIRL